MSGADVNNESKIKTLKSLKVENIQNITNEGNNNKQKHIDIAGTLKVIKYDNPDTIPTMFTAGVNDVKGSLLFLDHTTKAASNTNKYGRVHYDNGALKLDNSRVITEGNAAEILGNLNLISETGDTNIINTADNSKIVIDAQGASGDIDIKAADDITIEPTDTLNLKPNKLIYTSDTITVGDNGGGEVSATVGDGSVHNPVRPYIYLKVNAGSTATQYIWNLTGYTGSDGQVLHLFFNNSDVSGASLKINLNSLASGSGDSNTFLVFNKTGQSSSLFYIDSKWRIMNAGAIVG